MSLLLLPNAVNGLCYSMTLTDAPSAEQNLALHGVRHRARVSYDGSGFNGWQVQTGKSKARTVQGEIEACLSTRFDQTIKVVGSGRTDTGVHARGQAIHFDLPYEFESEEELRKLERSLNSMLKRDVRLWNLQLAPRSRLILDASGDRILQQKWHAIVDSKGKLYCYRFSKAHFLDPLERHHRSHFHEKFCVDKFRVTMSKYVGTHDFRAFAGAVEANEKKKGRTIGTVRTVHQIDVLDEGHERYRVDIYLEGALYKMVRNMVGTALAVASGQMSEERFETLLSQRQYVPSVAESAAGKVTASDSRLDDENISTIFTRDDNPSKPAKPEGLTLEYVEFNNCGGVDF